MQRGFFPLSGVLGCKSEIRRSGPRATFLSHDIKGMVAMRARSCTRRRFRRPPPRPGSTIDASDVWQDTVYRIPHDSCELDEIVNSLCPVVYTRGLNTGRHSDDTIGTKSTQSAYCTSDYSCGATENKIKFLKCNSIQRTDPHCFDHDGAPDPPARLGYSRHLWTADRATDELSEWVAEWHPHLHAEPVSLRQPAAIADAE